MDMMGEREVRLKTPCRPPCLLDCPLQPPYMSRIVPITDPLPSALFPFLSALSSKWYTLPLPLLHRPKPAATWSAQGDGIVTPSGPTECASDKPVTPMAQVIRNETLLLLSSLTRTNEEVKKIVVFEGAFDRLLAIIKEEVRL
eukprot:8997419-Pyramimonas_sp.AAC.1